MVGGGGVVTRGYGGGKGVGVSGRYAWWGGGGGVTRGYGGEGVGVSGRYAPWGGGGGGGGGGVISAIIIIIYFFGIVIIIIIIINICRLHNDDYFGVLIGDIFQSNCIDVEQFMS